MRVLTGREFCNVGNVLRLAQHERGNTYSSLALLFLRRELIPKAKDIFLFWFTRIIYDVDSGYLQSTNVDQLRACLQLFPLLLRGREINVRVLTGREFCNVGKERRDCRAPSQRAMTENLNPPFFHSGGKGIFFAVWGL